jgi:hypothetical protein
MLTLYLMGWACSFASYVIWRPWKSQKRGEKIAALLCMSLWPLVICWVFWSRLAIDINEDEVGDLPLC